MTNSTLKSTIEAIIASSALVVVTLDGTFNSQTGAPILSPRTRPDQRNAFLKQYCEKVTSEEHRAAHAVLVSQKVSAVQEAKDALEIDDYNAAMAHIGRALQITEQLDQPRVYYRVKPDADLRTVAEKRAARKAENEQKRAASKAARETKAAEKMTAKVQADRAIAPPAPIPPIAETKGAKNKKAA
jgi:hypothetical protein